MTNQTGRCRLRDACAGMQIPSSGQRNTHHCLFFLTFVPLNEASWTALQPTYSHNLPFICISHGGGRVFSRMVGSSQYDLI